MGVPLTDRITESDTDWPRDNNFEGWFKGWSQLPSEWGFLLCIMMPLCTAHCYINHLPHATSYPLLFPPLQCPISCQDPYSNAHPIMCPSTWHSHGHWPHPQGQLSLSAINVASLATSVRIAYNTSICILIRRRTSSSSFWPIETLLWLLQQHWWTHLNGWS
jgi:hypothetical protein